MGHDKSTRRKSGPLSIRQAETDDTGVMQDLFTRFYREEGFGADAIAAIPRTLPDIIARPDTVAFIARLGGAPVGAAAASTSFGLEVGLYAELEDLYVVPAARGQGVAGMLVDAVKDWASTLGCHDVEVVLTPQAQSNQTLVHWYSKRGFARTGRVILECPLDLNA